MSFEGVPISVQAAALRLLRQAERNVNACGDSLVEMGYWIESHTLGCRDEGGDTDLWAAHWEFLDKYSNDGISILIGDPASGAFVSITPQRDRKATMGAELLIELGGTKRKSGYIHLELFSPREDGSGDWVLRIERIDPFGGDSWKRDFPFEDEGEARSWFKGIIGDEDLDLLISKR